MATTADYLSQLQTDKQLLADILKEKGIEVSEDETFTTMIPKIADIQTDTGPVYTALNYVRSSGSQYLDTGIYPDLYTNMEISYYKDGIRTDARDCIFGCTGQGFNYSFCDRFNSSLYIKAAAYGDTDYASWSTADNVGQPSKMQVSNGRFTFLWYRNNNWISSYIDRSNVNACSASSIYLFANRNANNVAEYHSKIALYYCKIWQHGNLVRDFIPCRDENGTVCLFDNVTCKFFYAVGSLSAG